MIASILSIALQSPALPTIEEVERNLRASPTCQATMGADVSFVTTWTNKYSRFLGDFGTRRQTIETELHRWRGHYPMFSDRLVSSVHGAKGDSFYINYCFDGKSPRYLTPEGMTIEDDDPATIKSPDSYIRNIWDRRFVDEMAKSDFQVAGWVDNRDFGRCLRLKAEIYRGEPMTFDLSPEHDWAMVRMTVLRKDIPLLKEQEVVKLVHGCGTYFCAEGVEREIHLTPKGPRLLMQEKMFATQFHVRPFVISEFQKLTD